MSLHLSSFWTNNVLFFPLISLLLSLLSPGITLFCERYEYIHQSLICLPFGRYDAERPLVLIQSVLYFGIIVMTRVARPNLSKLCYRRENTKSIFLIRSGQKLIALWSIVAAYIIPFFLIPHTVHPLIGWGLYLLGSFALSCIAMNTFLLPMLPVLVPWLGIFGVLLVMAYPWYSDGIVRALAVFAYAFCASPVAWTALVKIMSCLNVSLEREGFLPRLSESAAPAGFNKLY